MWGRRRGEQESHEVPRAERVPRFEIERNVDSAIGEALGSVVSSGEEIARSLVRRLRERLPDLAAAPERLRVSVAEATRDISDGIEQGSAYGKIAVLGVFLGGCAVEEPAEVEEKKGSEVTVVTDQPSPVFGAFSLSGPEILGAAPELSSITPPDCGPAAPKYAPDECGIQQWLGYSESNPAAVAWMAIANTGTEACAVAVTRL